MNEVQAELQQIQEGTSVHKRRVQDMLANILRDLSEVGSLVGGNVADMKVRDAILLLQKETSLSVGLG